MSKLNYKQILPNISTFIFDVDGVLTDGNVLITGEGQLLRSMNTKDGYALKCAIQQGYKVAIISGGTDEGVRDRLKALGIYDIYLGAHHKTEAYQDLLDNYNLDPKSILYMGDDVPDVPVMEKVGLPCCPHDATHDVKKVSVYVSPYEGGKGCVRDAVEQTLRVQGKWEYMGAADDQK